MVARPVCGPAVPERNTAGAALFTTKLKLLLTPAGVWMLMVTLPPMFNGNCALTWPPETYNSGIGEPFTTRHDCPSAVGSGICDVAMLVALICAP